MDIFNKRSKPYIGFLVSGVEAVIGKDQLEVSEITSLLFIKKINQNHAVF